MWTCLRRRQVAGRDVILTRHGKVHVGRSHAFSPSCCRSKCIATPVEWMRGRSLAIPLSVILVAHVKLNQPVEVVQSSRECCHSRLKTVRTWLLFPLTQPVFFFLQPLHQGLTQITRSNQLFVPQRNLNYTRDDSHQVSFVFFCDYRRFRRELSPPGCELRKTAQHLSQNQMPEILMIGRWVTRKYFWHDICTADVNIRRNTFHSVFSRDRWETTKITLIFRLDSATVAIHQLTDDVRWWTSLHDSRLSEWKWIEYSS